MLFRGEPNQANIAARYLVMRKGKHLPTYRIYIPCCLGYAASRQQSYTAFAVQAKPSTHLRNNTSCTVPVLSRWTRRGIGITSTATTSIVSLYRFHRQRTAVELQFIERIGTRFHSSCWVGTNIQSLSTPHHLCKISIGIHFGAITIQR